MAGKKPIRWDVPPSCENLMGYAMYLRDQQENLRLSFSQPSRSVQIPLPDGILVSMVLGPVVDFIRVRGPERKVVSSKGKRMAWNKLPPLQDGTVGIDFSKMTEDPGVSGSYYCVISVINGLDENGKVLPATFSINATHTGWSIYQGTRQSDGTYKADGTNATLRLYEPLIDGACEIIADDGRTTLKTPVSAFRYFFYYLGENALYYTVNSTTGMLDYFTAGKTPEQVSVSPFIFYGQQHIKREDVTSYVCTYRHIESWTVSIHSTTFLYEENGHIRYDVVFKYEQRSAWLVVAGTGSSSDTTEVTYSVPIYHWDYELGVYPYTEILVDTTVDSYTTDITTVGSATLPSFLVGQLPMFDGDGVTTIAMKKPDEEVYFVVCYHDNDPTNKTIHWFINSESYASYAFSEDLWMDGVPLRLDNVYYGHGV